MVNEQNNSENVQPYEAPVLRVVGTVHELTLGCKDFSGSDGMYLMNPSITLGSC